MTASRTQPLRPGMFDVPTLPGDAWQFIGQGVGCTGFAREPTDVELRVWAEGTFKGEVGGLDESTGVYMGGYGPYRSVVGEWMSPTGEGQRYFYTADEREGRFDLCTTCMTAKVDEAKLAQIYSAYTGHLKRIAEETVRAGVRKVEKSVAHILSQITGYEKGFDENRDEHRSTTLVTTIPGIGSFPATQPLFIDRADNVSIVCAVSEEP